MKKIIIVLLIIIFVILSMILIINNKNNDEYEDGLGAEFVVKQYITTPEKNASVFYAIEDCVQRYLNDTVITENDTVQNKNQYKNIYDLLDSDYKKNNNINVDNIKDYITLIDIPVRFIALKMEYISYDNNLQEYRVFGKLCKESTGEFIEYNYYKITLDINNMTYSIEPKNNCNTLNDVVLDDYEIDKEIEYNPHNSYSYFSVEDSNLMNYYLDYIKNALLNTPEEIYNILDNDFKNSNFSTLDEFKNFIEENKKIIEDISLNNFEAEDMVMNTIFTCEDNNHKKYIINQQAIMDFSLILEY